jgi:hypothetical protein
MSMRDHTTMVFYEHDHHLATLVGMSHVNRVSSEETELRYRYHFTKAGPGFNGFHNKHNYLNKATQIAPHRFLVPTWYHTSRRLGTTEACSLEHYHCML